MENLGDIDRQTLAGAISTATHGTGADFRNLSAQVEALELVLADGSVLEVSERTDRDAYRAARVGLGALGVIYSVTLRAVPAFTLHRVDSPRPLEETLASLDELAARNDHFEFFVFPYTDTALTIERNRTDGPPTPSRPRRAPTSTRSCSRTTPWTLLSRVGRRLPATIPRLVGFAARQFSHTEKIDRSYRVFASERRVRFTEMEYAIPREHGAEAVRRVLEPGARAPAARSAFRSSFALVAADDALLSPAHERETAYVAVHQYQGAAWEPYFRAVEEIMSEYGGPPALGQAPLPDGGDAGEALSALARLPAGPRPARPRGAFLATPTRTASWARSARLIRRSLEERLALAAVGRHLVDDPVALDEVERVEALAELAGLGVAQVDAVADPQAPRRRSRAAASAPRRRPPACRGEGPRAGRARAAGPARRRPEAR